MIEAGLEIGEINIATRSIDVNREALIQFQCSSSTDCCSKLKIPVTDFDIKRIEDQGYELDQIISEASPILRFPKTDAGSAEKNYWMKTKPFDGTCTFLIDNKCSIHEFKPFGCRVFPFSLKILDEERIKVRIHPTNLCRTIKPAKLRTNNNEKLLREVMETVISENNYRTEYFTTYSDEI